MKIINLNEFRIIPIVESSCRTKISDDEYFSNKYSNYISNSRLSHIDPTNEGSWTRFQNPPKLSTASLALGSAIHELTLESETFKLFPKCDKPTAKLGKTIDKIKFYRRQGETILNSIEKACVDCDYYTKSIKNHIDHIISAGYKYYLQTYKYDESYVTLDDTSWEKCNECLKSLKNNAPIQDALHPTNDDEGSLPSFNEDTLLMEVVVIYKENCTVLPLKMKADNWTIDEENKVLTLNDLKTTSKPCGWFMKDYGSFNKYHYYRQFYMYMYMLQNYCIKEYGFNHKWKHSGNVLVVNTEDYESRLFRVNKSQFEKGKEEFERLIKMVAYYSMFGPDEVEFK